MGDDEMIGPEGIIVCFSLLTILFGILYFVVKAAFDNSKVASDLEEIKMILRTQVTKATNSQNEG